MRYIPRLEGLDQRILPASGLKSPGLGWTPSMAYAAVEIVNGFKEAHETPIASPAWLSYFEKLGREGHFASYLSFSISSGELL